jgi:multidrug efflux pump subunit AcrB
MAPELPDPAFAKIVALTPDAEAREALKHRLRSAVSEGLAPEASVRVTQLVFGPYTPFPVEFRIMGPDSRKLYQISEEALAIMRSVPDVR